VRPSSARERSDSGRCALRRGAETPAKPGNDLQKLIIEILSAAWIELAQK
jgi:hypothetical protein